jgi:TPR repeat protein
LKDYGRRVFREFRSASYGKENDVLAKMWFEKAADKSLADAQYLLGDIYENGHGVHRNRKVAISRYRPKATLKD